MRVDGRLLISAAVFALFAASLSAVSAQTPRIHTAALPPSIRSPLPTLPVPVLNGSWFLARVSGPASTEGWSIWIEAPGHAYNISGFEAVPALSKPGSLVVNITVPGDVAPDLYDLYIDVGGETVSSPRSVWVMSRWPDKLTIAHLTDIHIGVIDASGRTAINYMISEVMLINMLPVDLVVVTGDNADVGSMVWHHKVFLQVLNLLRKPSIVIPGNHEYAGDPSLHNYLSLVGYRYHATRLGRFLLIGLDTGSDGYFDTEELHWAEELLENSGKNSTVIMFWHHPPFQATVAARVNGDPAKGRFTVDGVKVDPETHRPTGFKGTRSYGSGELFYSSWNNHVDQLRELLTWTQKYNVALVLNGHVHNDGTVLFNDKTWFITTSPAGGPAWRDTPGSHHGFRLVDVYANGTVHVWKTNGKPVFSNFNSIDMEKAEADLIYGEDSALLQLSFKDLPDLSLIPGDYEVWLQIPSTKANLTLECGGFKAESVEVYRTTRATYYVVKPSDRLRPDSSYSISVYAEKDAEKPDVRIVRHQPAKPTPSSGVKISVKAVDSGWGVKEVYVEYRMPSGETRTIKATPQYGRSVNAFTLPSYFTVTIPPMKTISADKPYIEVRAIAIDAAGNRAETGWTKITYNVPTTHTTTTTTQATTTATTTTTTQPTTTTTTTTRTTTHTTTTTTSTSTPGGGVNVALILGVIGIAIVAVLVIALASRRR